MIEVDAALESRETWVSAWDTFVRALDPDADVRRLAGIRMVWADSALVLWRSAVLTDTGLEPDVLASRLCDAVGLLAAKPQPGLLWVFEDLLAPDARTALPEMARASGLDEAFTCEGQAGDVLPLPEPHHPDLTFQRVRTADQVRAFARLNAEANAMATTDFDDGMSRDPRTWTTDVHTWLGLRDGVPVTCAAVLPCRGVLYVLAVATCPGHERRGYGEAVTRAALHDAGGATGLRRAVLHATEVGAPVYPRIGFAPTTTVRAYTGAS